MSRAFPPSAGGTLDEMPRRFSGLVATLALALAGCENTPAADAGPLECEGKQEYGVKGGVDPDLYPTPEAVAEAVSNGHTFTLYESSETTATLLSEDRKAVVVARRNPDGWRWDHSRVCGD
jgi:hypothetical protein